MSLPMITCVVQEAVKILSHEASPVSHSCHYQHSFADLTDVLLPFCIFYFFLSLLFCCILLFLPAMSSLHIIYSSASAQPCWRDQLPLGNDFILPPEKPTPSPPSVSSLTHLGSWEQETVSSISSFQNIPGTQLHSRDQSRHTSKAPQLRRAALKLQCLRLLLSSLPVSHVYLSHLIIPLSAVPSPHLAKKCVLSQTFLTTQDKNSLSFTFLLSSSHNQLIDK